MTKQLLDEILFITYALFLFLYLKIRIVADSFGVDYSSNNPLESTNIIVFVMLSITVGYTLANYSKKRSLSIVRTITALCIGIYLVSVFISIRTPLESISTYGLLLLPLSTFYYFYSLSRKYGNTKLMVTTMSVVFLSLCITYFFVRKKQFSIMGLREFTSPSYYMLYMLPFLLCVKNKGIKLLLIVLATTVVFLSYKRTGSIAIVLSILVYGYIAFLLNKNKWIQNIILVLIAVFIIYFILANTNILSDSYLIYRLQNISVDQGSGRTDVWETTWQMIGKTNNIWQLLFGHGFNRVIADSPIGYSAHNDFLEIIYDFGFLIFIIYLNLYVRLIRQIIQLIKNKKMQAAPIAASFILLIVGSLSSHIIIYVSYFILFTMFWGMSFGSLQHESLNTKLK